MKSASHAGTSRIIARRATRGVKTARALKVRSKRERRRGLIVGLVMLAVIGSGAAFAMITDLPASLLARLSPEPSMQAPDPDARKGIIVLQPSAEQCRSVIFDNDTGRMTDVLRPCSKEVLDAQGVPVPHGTIRRIDAISKSFSFSKDK
jgi:hypothetical protein